MKIFVIIIVVLCFAVGAYFEGGGFATNSGSLYKKYKESNLSLKDFIRLLFKR